ncbi:MAG: acyl carrier protein [Vicinamibacterales bacterium]
MPEHATSREAFNVLLIAFITALVRSRAKSALRMPQIKVDASTPLFETGLIDSLGILELMAYVEEATGRPIPIQKVDMKYFGTVDRISRSFWHGTEGGHV